MSQTISHSQVKHVAQLANIPISDTQADKLSQAFSDTLSVIDNLKSVNISGIEPTHQVTGLENIWRQDQVDESRTLTQAQALSNAKKTYQGYFMVPMIMEEFDR